MSSSLSVVVSLVVSKKPYVLNSVFDNLLMSQKSQIGKGDLNKTNPSLLGIKKEWWSSKATEKLESEKVSKTLINQRDFQLAIKDSLLSDFHNCRCGRKNN
ncbi:uncharacterized protein LOC107632046 isoform X5 [Arachis ipaensis]|uniref:uncharacterized protein LOC107632046 isoform X5 n=1 Tax=Arachis ipaensis TaxID=130454 RepID=UPI000A2AFAF7|nr:uncharacterized protein LOC107632046 isoform X5 [Arachis ipaensis]